MKLPKTLKYAIGAVLELSQGREGDVVSCTVIATNRKIPKRFLLQILRKLVAAGVLRSTRGADGGYALNRAPEEVSLFDIIRIFETPFDESEDFFMGFAPETQRLLLSTIRASIAAQRDALSGLSVAQLAQAESGTIRERDPGKKITRRDKPISPITVKNGLSPIDRVVNPASANSSRS